MSVVFSGWKQPGNMVGEGFLAGVCNNDMQTLLTQALMCMDGNGGVLEWYVVCTLSEDLDRMHVSICSAA
jgi:hypothetical protein